MARRKNVKRIDPRYFLHETVNRNDDGSVLDENEKAQEHCSQEAKTRSEYEECMQFSRSGQAWQESQELEEAESQDTGFGEEDREVNRAADSAQALSGYEELQAQTQILNTVVDAAVEAVGDWIDDDDQDWPQPGIDDRETFLKKLDAYSQTYAGVSVADVLGN